MRRNLATNIKQKFSYLSAYSVLIGRLVVPLLLLLLLIIGNIILGERIVPSLSDITGTLVNGFITEQWLLDQTWITIWTLAQAFFIALIVGIPTAVFFGYRRFFGDVFEPIILSAYAVPKVTLYPIFLLIFGITVQSRVLYGIVSATPLIIIIVYNGMKDIKEVHMNVGKSFNLSQWGMFKKIVFPSITPQILVSFRFGFNFAFLGVIIAEMFAGHEGLGNQLVQAMSTVQTTTIYAILFIVVIIGVSMNMLLYYYQESRMAYRSESESDVTAL